MFWRMMPNKKGKSNEKNVRKASRYNFENGKLYADNLQLWVYKPNKLQNR